MSQLLLISYKPSVCTKAVLEQTVLFHPLKHYLDNIVLQEVVYCYHNGEKKIINKRRQTDHFNPEKCRSFLSSNCKESQGVSEYSFLHHQKALGNWRKLTGRGLADPKPQHNQKTSFWESTACVIGGSPDSSFKRSLGLGHICHGGRGVSKTCGH